MAWTLVQNTGNQVGSGTSVSGTFGSAVGSGHIVCGMVFWTNTVSTNFISSITDNGTPSNTYSQVQFFSANPTQQYNIATFWSGTTRLTNSPTIVTVNLSSSQSNVWITLGEFTPPNSGTLSLDGNASVYTATSPPSVGPITTTNNGDLIFAAGAVASDSLSTGTGYTTVNVTGAGSVIRSEFESQTSAGSISGTWSGTMTDGAFGIFAVSSIASAANPLINYDWPNPPSITWYRYEQNRLSIPNPSLINRLNDWPNPQPIQWYRDWSQTRVQLLPSPVLINRQNDWPNPPPVQWYRSLEVGRVQLLPAPAFININRDWPNPLPITWYRDWNQNLVINQPSFTPFVQTDWPLPYPIYWYQWFYQNLVPYLPLAQLPFNQSDWPLPRTSIPIDQYWYQTLVLNLPEPPPPPVITSSGHQWTEADVLRSWMAAIGKKGRAVRYAP